MYVCAYGMIKSEACMHAMIQSAWHDISEDRCVRVSAWDDRMQVYMHDVIQSAWHDISEDSGSAWITGRRQS